MCIHTYIWALTAPRGRRRAEPIDFKRRPLFARHEKLALSAVYDVRAGLLWCVPRTSSQSSLLLSAHTHTPADIYLYFFILLRFVSPCPDNATARSTRYYGAPLCTIYRNNNAPVNARPNRFYCTRLCRRTRLLYLLAVGVLYTECHGFTVCMYNW